MDNQHMSDDNFDNSWFSERTKTVIVVIIMTVLVVGMGWGYYEAHQWKKQRHDWAVQMEQMERISKPDE